MAPPRSFSFHPSPFGALLFQACGVPMPSHSGTLFYIALFLHTGSLRVSGQDFWSKESACRYVFVP